MFGLYSMEKKRQSEGLGLRIARAEKRVEANVSFGVLI